MRCTAKNLFLAFALVFGSGTAALAQQRAPSPNRVIYPGEIIAAEAIGDVGLRRGVVLGADTVRMPDEAIGKVARRTLVPGRVIPMAALRNPFLVTNGAPTQVLFEADGLQISATAVPMQDGSAGDLIRLRNMDSGAIFMGVVLADGTIRVGAS